MNKITSSVELRNAISLLEIKQKEEGVLLKEQAKLTYESLKPINLIKTALHDLAQAPDLKGDLMNATIGLAAGYLSKKVVVRDTHNPLKQLLGTFLQMGVSTLVTKNAEGIKSLGSRLLSSLFTKKNYTENEIGY